MMMMMRDISASVWIACLIACASGTVLVRNKRNFVDGDYYYGKCGKPTTPVPHGGIKLFPTYSTITNPKDSSCYSCYPICPQCEPMFYCDDGYTAKGTFHLDCVRNSSTFRPTYKWEGSIPTCEEDTFSDSLVKILPGIILPVSLIIGSVLGACRIHARRTRTTINRPARRTGICSNVTTISVTPSWRPIGGRTPGLALLTNPGPPGYSRFDDSQVEVPRDESPPDTHNAEGTPTEEDSRDEPPPYTTDQLYAYTQEDTGEVKVESASTPRSA